MDTAADLRKCSPIWTRTKNLPVNSRLLCQLSYGGSRLTRQKCQARATGTRVHDAVVARHTGYRHGASARLGMGSGHSGPVSEVSASP